MNALAAIGRELRYGVRMLVKRPLFLAATVLSIAIGAGLNIGIFAVLRHVMFDNPMTAAAPERLLRIQPGISFPNYQDLRRIGTPIDLTAMQMGTLTWRTGDATRTLSAHVVSDNFFDTVGVQPLIGRTFSSGDAGADVVVLSFPFWQRYCGSDPATIGRSLELNGWPHAIVGVLPKGFATNPMMGGVVYVPIGSHVSTALDNRRAAQFDLIGHLHAGLLPGEALAALRLAAGHVESEFPEINRGFAAGLQASSTDAFSMLRQGPAGRVVLAAAVTLYGLVGLVLFVACANVAGLMLVRADERRHEVAVRIALGATQGRLIQHVFVESLVIGALGCVAGVGLWIVAVSMLRNIIAGTATVDVTALSASIPWGYCLLLVSGITVACGLASAARMSRLSRPGDREARLGGRFSRRFRLQRGLVAVQIAICFVLLVAAAFFVANVARLRIADAGFDIDHILSVDVRVPTFAQARDQLAVRTAIAAEPGVESVSWGSPIGPPFTERLERVGAEDGNGASVDVRRIGPRFLETMRIPVIRGRDLINSDLDAADPINIVVNETFARLYLASVDPIGQRFVRRRNSETARPRQVLQIAGVARDSMARTIGESRVPVVYLPQMSRSLTIRVAYAGPRAMSALQDRIRTLEPPGSLVAVVPFADDVAAAIAPVRIATVLLGILGTIAVALASTGLYAVVSYVVTQRTFEIGVRVALGATRLAIASMILRDGIRVVATGCVFGAALSWLVARIVQTLIVGQAVVGPTVFVAVACLLLVVGITASLRPAQRAAAADPIKALRYE